MPLFVVGYAIRILFHESPRQGSRFICRALLVEHIHNFQALAQTEISFQRVIADIRIAMNEDIHPSILWNAESEFTDPVVPFHGTP